MDPLSVLRDYTIRGDLESIRVVGEDFHFGEDYRFPSNIDTAYRSKQGSLYTLECLVFFLKNVHLKHTEYMQQARLQKLQTVIFTDRKPLQDYLEGKISTTDAIELVAPAGPHAPPEKPIKRHWDEANHVEEYRPEDPSLGFYDNNNNNNGNKRIRIDTEGGDMVGSEIEPKITDMLPQIDLVRAKERPLKDRETLLECPNKNFQSVLSIANRRSEDQQRKEHDRSNLHTPSKNHYGNTDEKSFWKNHLGTDTADLGIDPTQSYIGQSIVKPEGAPIILVPSAFQTLLNIYNAKDFLEDGVYVAPDVKAKQMPKKPECVTIQRKIGREKVPVAYEIRDKPSALTPNDWERVVVVFVLGKRVAV
jgi:parafibromin